MHKYVWEITKPQKIVYKLRNFFSNVFFGKRISETSKDVILQKKKSDIYSNLKYYITLTCIVQAGQMNEKDAFFLPLFVN